MARHEATPDNVEDVLDQLKDLALELDHDTCQQLCDDLNDFLDGLADVGIGEYVLRDQQD